MSRVLVETIEDFDHVHGELLNAQLEFEDMKTGAVQSLDPAGIRYYTHLMIDARDWDNPAQLDLIDAVTLPNMRLRSTVRVKTVAGIVVERSPRIVTRLTFDESV